jgi:uncharacterized protein YdhG (YjbR/CyaY superfamily)
MEYDELLLRYPPNHIFLHQTAPNQHENISLNQQPFDRKFNIYTHFVYHLDAKDVFCV